MQKHLLLKKQLKRTTVKYSEHYKDGCPGINQGSFFMHIISEIAILHV